MYNIHIYFFNLGKMKIIITLINNCCELDITFSMILPHENLKESNVPTDWSQLY